jgi:hypothetical protein
MAYDVVHLLPSMDLPEAVKDPATKINSVTIVINSHNKHATAMKHLFLVASLLYILAFLMERNGSHTWGWFFGCGIYFTTMAVVEPTHERQKKNQNQNPNS